MQGESENGMLESRSAYGYCGTTGGYTGETPPDNVIYKKMKYWDYKNKYPECKNLGDYDKIEKTITVILPAEYAKRPNFGNTYSMHDFHFTYSPVIHGFSDTFECTAKNYKNALAAAKRWASKNGKIIVGDTKGYEYQKQFRIKAAGVILPPLFVIIFIIKFRFL